jgi:endoglucanase
MEDMGIATTLFLAAAALPAANDIRMNQIGFQPGVPHRAIVRADASAPLPWLLGDRAGRAIARGRTEPFGADGDSGENVHRIDFQAEAGRGYRLKVGPKLSRPFVVSPRLYDRLPSHALNYFYQNRAGVPIEARFAGGPAWARPAGHVNERATSVSGKDSKGNVWPGCSYTLDVSGGWYDAGDHGKYIVNGGITLWTLLNLYERQQALGKASTFADGKALLPEAGNGVNDLLDEARFEIEFFLKMQVPDGTRMRLPVGVKRTAENMTFTEVDVSGMVHHKVASERWTPVPTVPHEDRLKRQLFPPSTAATLNFAATMAQCARIWRSIDPSFSERCRAAAEKAWRAARRNPEIWAIADFTGSGAYGDGNVSDEFYWAAAELFATTGADGYLSGLRQSPHFANSNAAEPSWPGVAMLGTITLATVPTSIPDSDRQRLRASLVAASDRFLADTQKQGYAIPYAPQSWPWGSTSSVLNRAMVLALAHDFTRQQKYRTGVTDAMDFILGRNPLDVSFVAGYGTRAMRNPHHRHWANMLDPKLPVAPPGAISGGPNNGAMNDPVALQLKGKCAPMKCWADDTRSYALNEVAINWNAPLVWVSAWLAERR